MDPNITDAAREAARHSDGRFGAQSRPEAVVDLAVSTDGTDSPTPACPTCRGTGGDGGGPCWDCQGTGQDRSETTTLPDSPAATTQTGIPIIDCVTCGHRHPVTRPHCGTCGLATLFRCGRDDCERAADDSPEADHRRAVAAAQRLVGKHTPGSARTLTDYAVGLERAMRDADIPLPLLTVSDRATASAFGDHDVLLDHIERLEHAIGVATNSLDDDHGTA